MIKPLKMYKSLLLCFLVLITITGCSSFGFNETIKPFAAVYYSTDITNEKISDGISYIFLIDEQGRYKKINERGLELNSLIPFKGSLLLNQKKDLLSIQQSNDVEKVTSYEDTCKVSSGYGQSSGQINNLFYSIYNQSFSKDGKYYISKVRWGDQEKHYCKDINEYIDVAGNDGRNIYFISADVDTETNTSNKKSFNKVSIEGGNLTVNKTPLVVFQSEGVFMFSKLASYKNDMVGIIAELVGDKAELSLLQIDKDNKTPLKKHPLLKYDSTNTKYYFFNNESIYVKDELVYFVDGYGDVFTYNLQTEKLMKKFHLNEYTRELRVQDEMVYFADDYLYFYHYDNNTTSHRIEKYDLEGKVISTIPVPNLKKEIGRDSVNLYDFKIVQP